MAISSPEKRGHEQSTERSQGLREKSPKLEWGNLNICCRGCLEEIRAVTCSLSLHWEEASGEVLCPFTSVSKCTILQAVKRTWTGAETPSLSIPPAHSIAVTCDTTVKVGASLTHGGDWKPGERGAGDLNRRSNLTGEPRSRTRGCRSCGFLAPPHGAPPPPRQLTANCRQPK